MRAMTRHTPISAALVLTAAATAACSSPAPARTPGVGDVIAPTTTTASVAPTPAELGKPITVGALTMTISGPATVTVEDGVLDVAFPASLANTSTAGDVQGPDTYGIRCDANRAGPVGDWMSTTTVGGRPRIAAAKTLNGTVVVGWLKWNTSVKCAGAVTLEAAGQGGTWAWTIPGDQVEKINALVQ